MTNRHDQSARMEAFAGDVAGLEDFKVEEHDTEVAVVVIGDEDEFSVDFREAFRAAHRYGLVAFDGEAGANVVTLHFMPREEVFGDGA